MRFLLPLLLLALTCESARLRGIRLNPPNPTIDPLAVSLLVYWPLTETSGTTAADLSGNGHTATFGAGTPAPVWTNDLTHRGLHFWGGTGGLYSDNFADSLTNMTVSFWIKHYTDVGQGAVMSKLSPGGTSVATGWIAMDENHQARTAWGTPTEWIETSDQNPDAYINDGAWHHIACVKAGTNCWSFKDGTLIGGPVAGPGLPLATSYSTTNTVRIGFTGSVEDPVLKALVAGLRIYNVVKTTNEVVAIYNAGP